jgi:hypothetical protein
MIDGREDRIRERDASALRDRADIFYNKENT